MVDPLANRGKINRPTPYRCPNNEDIVFFDAQMEKGKGSHWGFKCGSGRLVRWAHTLQPTNQATLDLIFLRAPYKAPLTIYNALLKCVFQ